MAEELLKGLSDNDILFLLETVEPRLIARIETIKGDPSIIEGILEQENERFSLAKKPLNFISENSLQFKKQKLFPSVSSN